MKTGAVNGTALISLADKGIKGEDTRQLNANEIRGNCRDRRIFVTVDLPPGRAATKKGPKLRRDGILRAYSIDATHHVSPDRQTDTDDKRKS